MGDSTDGSSGAARGARRSQPTKSGMLGRLMGLIGPRQKANPTIADAHADHGAHAHATMLNLRRMRIDDVAVPRAEIVALPFDADLKTVVQSFRASGLSRLPVFKGTLDTPIGLIHLKDLALQHGFNGKEPKFSLRSLVRPLLFAPPSMTVGVLLQKMQSERRHMALVIDEYGGVDGLVTLEDLIETVIGEIEDEHDIDDSEFWTEERPGVWMCLSKTPLEDFEKVIGMPIPDPTGDEEVDTLGGLVFVLSGHVPTRGEVIKHPNGLEFEVIEADPRRIKKLRVCLPDQRKAA